MVRVVMTRDLLLVHQEWRLYITQQNVDRQRDIIVGSEWCGSIHSITLNQNVTQLTVAASQIKNLSIYKSKFI